eukprot:8290519-Pyramimonas_sp.AAC.3
MSGNQQVYIVRVGEESSEVSWESLRGMSHPPAPIPRPSAFHLTTSNPRARSRAWCDEEDGPATLDYRDKKSAVENSFKDWMAQAATTRLSDSI